MEKQITYSIYRSRKECFDNDNLDDLARELTRLLQKTVSIVSIPNEDGEYIKFIIGE